MCYANNTFSLSILGSRCPCPFICATPPGFLSGVDQRLLVKVRIPVRAKIRPLTYSHLNFLYDLDFHLFSCYFLDNKKII